MLNRVTFTGIDNHTEPKELIRLQEEFPFVEFGVLISSRMTDKDIHNRYPNLNFLKSLKEKGLFLSCHICGSAAKSVVTDGDWNEFQKIIGDNLDLFQRIQLNVGMFRRFSKNISFLPPFSYIIQLKQFPGFYQFYRELSNVFGFQDNSGGRGVYREDWVSLDERYFGYAGGICESNVAKAVEQIERIHPRPFWIDMESCVRTEDWFDPQKCRKILEICKPYI